MNGPSDDVWLALSGQPIDPGAVAAWSARPDCGAVVTFTGLTRDHGLDSDGRRIEAVTGLRYEAYETGCRQVMEKLAAEARHRWPDLGRVGLVHRHGHVPLGEPAVVVTAAAPHRGTAFAAASWLIDEVKATLPVWKQECTAEETVWSGETQRARPVSAVVS